MSQTDLQLPLQGFTIIEFSSMVTASLASMMLAEQGARVIKVEPPGVGDIMRILGASKGGISGLFANCNRGKESVALNLKHPQGVAIAQSLVSKADVLMTNYRPGVMDKLGLGSEPMREVNAGLVYLAITGFGIEGPLKDAPAYDPIVQALAGYTAIQGSEGSALVRNLICDKITAHSAAQAATAALLQRTHTGIGQHIDLSMLDAGLFFMYPDGFMNHTLLDEDVVPQPPLSDSISIAQAKDGEFVAAPVTPAQLSSFYKALGVEHLESDERFSTAEAVMQNMDLYREIMQQALDAISADDLVERLHAADVPAAKCLTREETLEQAQLRANSSLETAHHPVMGSLRQVRSPARFGARLLPLGAPCPRLGEQTDHVLGEFGVSASEVAALREQGAIG